MLEAQASKSTKTRKSKDKDDITPPVKSTASTSKAHPSQNGKPKPYPKMRPPPVDSGEETTSNAAPKSKDRRRRDAGDMSNANDIGPKEYVESFFTHANA